MRRGFVLYRGGDKLEGTPTNCHNIPPAKVLTKLRQQEGILDLHLNTPSSVRPSDRGGTPPYGAGIDPNLGGVGKKKKAAVHNFDLPFRGKGLKDHSENPNEDR